MKTIARRLATIALAVWTATGPCHAQPCPGDCDISGDVAFGELETAWTIALEALPVAKCFVADGDNDGIVAIDDLVRAVDRASGGCARQTKAFVLASDFQTGSFATVDLDLPRTVEPTRPDRRIGSDAVVRQQGHVIYVLNRFLANNLQAFDTTDQLRQLFQCSTGPGTNPHDIVVVDSQKAYVTAYESTKLLIVHPSPAPDCHDFVRGSIDLSRLADADGIPEMDQMAVAAGRLYVSLQQLDRRNFFAPARRGIIAVIDIEHDTLVDSFELTGSNPFASTKGLPLLNGDIVVSEVGKIGANDGGIERIELKTGIAKGFLITEELLGGDITDFVVLTEHLGYAAVSGATATSVVAFDPSEHRLVRTIYDQGAFVPDIEVDDRGELYVTDRTFNRPGLRLYRAGDGAELTDGVVPIGLPPFDILFFQ